MKKFLINVYPFINLIKTSKKQVTLKRSSLFIALVRLALMKRLFKSPRKVNIGIGQFKLISPNFETLSFLIKEKFIDEQYYFEETNKKPVIFDCGSSIGISVLYFKCLYPDSDIYAFEPNPIAFEFLQKNVQNNKLSNVHCYNLALSSQKDSIDFFIPKENPYINAKTFKIDLTEGEQILVPAVQLSEFLLTQKEVHLVKIDVEGSELDIINDLQKEVLKRKMVKKFIIEFHASIHRDKAILNNFLTTFESNGYLYKFIINEAAEAEGDKLILAYLPY